MDRLANMRAWILRSSSELNAALDLLAYKERGKLILDHINEFETKKANKDSKALSLV